MTERSSLGMRARISGLRPALRWAGTLGVAGLTGLTLSGCAQDSISFGDVAPASELYAEGLEILEGHNYAGVIHLVNYNRAIDTFQTIVDNYPYSNYAVDAEIQIADAYFDDGRYDEALSYYRDFGDLHPQHERVPYTTLRAALCHYKQIRSPDRDQTPTRLALQFLEQLVKSYPYTPETREGEVLLQELRTQLAWNVMKTGDFYLDRQEYQAAAARYRSILDTYPGLGADADALYKLGFSYEKMKRRDEALRLYRVVVENFKDAEVAELAEDRIAASQ